jgi:hypothetical protein
VIVQRYEVDAQRVAHEDVDGEIIAIDFVSGAYFNMIGTAAEIWRLLIAGYGDGAIADAYATTDSAREPAAGVRAFIAELTAARLIEPSAAPPRADLPPVNAYAAPCLDKFEDMAELIQLDPIHEVSERGWPHPGVLGQP